MRTVCASIVAALALPAATQATSTASGLRGTLTRGPIRPVCIEGQPCSEPAANTRLVFSRAGRSVSTRTDVRGRYRVALAPGSWSVRVPGAPRIGRGLSPSTVRVVAGRFRVVNLELDTGIR